MEWLVGFLSISVSGDMRRGVGGGRGWGGGGGIHKILLHDWKGTDIEVTYLRVAHLSLRQTPILTASHELRVSASRGEKIKIRCRGVVDNITAVVFAKSPTVEDHQQCFLCHSNIENLNVCTCC